MKPIYKIPKRIGFITQGAAPISQRALPIRQNTPTSLSSSSDTIQEMSVEATCFAQIHQQVEARLHYPLSLRRREIQGQVTVKLGLGANGKLEDLRVLKTSGHEELDQLALEAVSHAEPFSCIGAKTLGRLSLSLPIQFRLD